MNSDCYRAETARIRLPRQKSPTKPTSWRPALAARTRIRAWYGRRQRLNPARGKGAMSSDPAGDRLQLSPAENPLPLSFRHLHSARPARPFRKSGTGGSNPVPSSGESCKPSVPLSAMKLSVTEIRDGLSKRLSGQVSQEPQSLGWPISVVIVKVPGCISRVPFARGQPVAACCSAVK